MKFNDIKDQVKSGVELSELITFKYVSLSAQENMVDNIKKICIHQSNGFSKIDYTLKSLFEVLSIIVNYTDMEIEHLYDDVENIDSAIAIEVYDFCKEYKIYEYVLKNINSEDFFTILNNEIDQEVEINNSVAFIISNALNTIMSKIPSEADMGLLISQVPSMLESFSKPKANRKKKEV